MVKCQELLAWLNCSANGLFVVTHLNYCVYKSNPLIPVYYDKRKTRIHPGC
jgi:hypothetical protein